MLDLVGQWPSAWYSNLNISWGEVLELDLDDALWLRERIQETREAQAEKLRK